MASHSIITIFFWTWQITIIILKGYTIYLHKLTKPSAKEFNFQYRNMHSITTQEIISLHAYPIYTVQIKQEVFPPTQMPLPV